MSALHRAHLALALLGPSTHHVGRQKRATQELERLISDETNEPLDQVQDWAARQKARIQEIGEGPVVAEIERAFAIQQVTEICEARR